MPSNQRLYLLPKPHLAVSGEPLISLNSLNKAATKMDASIIHRMRQLGGFKHYQINCHIEQPTASTQQIPVLGGDEGYQLSVKDKAISIHAATRWGAMHGITTAYQLLVANQLQHDLSITDSPRFAWRGLLLDVARHFIPIALLQQVIDGIALLKMNVLHLHLTDDQGFRFRSERLPKLASKQAYSREELRQLVIYGAARGVRIVPEIDVPGHVTSWLAGYPELGAKVSPRPLITKQFGVHQACLNPASEIVYQRLATLFEEIAEIFLDDYIHIGGDEVNPTWWQANETVQTLMHTQGLDTITDLQNYFNGRVVQLLKGLGKIAIGWDEVLHPRMPHLMVQNWRGATTRDEILAQNLPCIVSAGYYLDLMYPCEFHYRYDPSAPQKSLLALEDHWQADGRMAHIAAGVAWTKQWRKGAVSHDGLDKNLLLGGEACLWGELVNEHCLPTRLWSRLPAVAERLWSAAEITDLNDFYHRLERLLVLPEFSLVERQKKQLAELGLHGEKADAAMLLEPVKWYARLLGDTALHARLQGTEMPQTRSYDTTTELNRVVDYLSPESLSARSLHTISDAQLYDHAQTWRDLPNQGWPEDLQLIMSDLRRLGEYVQSYLDQQLTVNIYVARLTALYIPRGEYLLAAIPWLLVRVQR